MIIDRETFRLAQQEITRRASKRRVSTIAVTEQGKYSSKFALTELLICGECGTPYRRCSWIIRGNKRKVWRCLNRLENGKKYCHESPTLDETCLHRAIVRTINDYYDYGDEVATILINGAEAVFKGQEYGQIRAIERRLAEIDKERNECIKAIASGAVQEDALDEQFRRLYEEEQQLTEQLDALKAQNQADYEPNHQLEAAVQEIRQADFHLTEYDDVLVRKLLECVRVVDQEHVQVIFKGGTEIMVEMEAKGTI